MTSETVVAGGSCSGPNGLTYQAAYDADGNATTLLYWPDPRELIH